MSDNSNNVHFSGVRFICSPNLAIKSALASLGPIMARCGAANESYALKMNIIVIVMIESGRRSKPKIPTHERICALYNDGVNKNSSTEDEVNFLFSCNWRKHKPITKISRGDL